MQQVHDLGAAIHAEAQKRTPAGGESPSRTCAHIKNQAGIDAATTQKGLAETANRPSRLLSFRAVAAHSADNRRDRAVTP